MKHYEETTKKDGSIYFLSTRKCPFQQFNKCSGEECALFTVTGYNDKKGARRDFGECALVKLPGFLIDVMRLLKELKRK